MSNDNKNSGGSRFSGSSPSDGNKKIIIIAAVSVVAVILIIVLLFALGDKKPDEKETETGDTSAITELPTVTSSETTTSETTTVTTTETTTVTTEPPPLVMREEIKDFYNTNKDTVGWIKVDGTLINSAVVQSEDNDYYLNHDFYGNSSYAGYVYADYRSVINEYSWDQSDNITIYGHNQKDGSMFGTLQYYKIKKSDTSRFDFYKEHPTFTFSNLYEDYTYKIVAIFVTEATKSQSRDGKIFDSHNFVKFSDDPADKRSFENFVKNINERSEVLTGVDMEETDKFMTLLTCSNEFDDSRFVVIGRRVRDGESAEVDTSKAVLNPDVIEPDLNFIYYGR